MKDMSIREILGLVLLTTFVAIQVALDPVTKIVKTPEDLNPAFFIAFCLSGVIGVKLITNKNTRKISQV